MKTIQTNFGEYPVPKSVSEIMENSPNCQFLKRYAYVAEKIAALAYVTNAEPKMPEAGEIP